MWLKKIINKNLIIEENTKTTLRALRKNFATFAVRNKQNKNESIFR